MIAVANMWLKLFTGQEFVCCPAVVRRLDCVRSMCRTCHCNDISFSIIVDGCLHLPHRLSIDIGTGQDKTHGMHAAEHHNCTETECYNLREDPQNNRIDCFLSQPHSVPAPNVPRTLMFAFCRCRCNAPMYADRNKQATHSPSLALQP